MLELFHGDNQVQSRQAFRQRLDTLKAEGRDLQRWAASQLSLPQLELSLGSPNLFGQAPVVVIEELQSLPKSAKKEALLSLVAQHQALDIHLVLWEKKAVTAAQQKKLAPTKAQEFKLASSLFKWLEHLQGNPTLDQRQKILKLQHQALQDSDEFSCFVMLIRQIRLLLQVKTGLKPPGAPFMIAKLEHQAKTFSLAELLQLHRDTFELDRRLKTSTSWLGLAAELDLLGWHR